MTEDYFERLGMPRRFSIDMAQLERQFLQRSRESHPDYFQTSDDAQQKRSLAESAELNQAYTTLKDPYLRAEYLLKLAGGPTAQEDKSLDPAFLMQMMELREQLIESRGDVKKVDRLRSEIDTQCQSLMKPISVALDENLAGANPADLQSIRRMLNAWKTLLTQRRDSLAD